MFDYASLEWISNADGSDHSAPYFTNLSLTPVDGQPSQGPSFVGAQMGCRKLINSRIVDTSLLTSETTENGKIVVTNTSKTTSPVRWRLNLRASKRRTSTLRARALSIAALRAVTPVYSSQSSGITIKLVRAGLSKGASPSEVNLIGTPQTPPPAGTASVYGPPNTNFTMTNTIETATKNWLVVTPSTGTFNQFGIATLTYTPNAAPCFIHDPDLTCADHHQRCQWPGHECGSDIG